MEKTLSKLDGDVEYNENVVPDVPPVESEQQSQIHRLSITPSEGLNEGVKEKQVGDEGLLPKAEGLHAWLVVFSAFLCNVITYGIGTSW